MPPAHLRFPPVSATAPLLPLHPYPRRRLRGGPGSIWYTLLGLARPPRIGSGSDGSMAILVTGTAGFIGFHVAAHLLDRGELVIGVDNLNPYYDVALKRDRLRAPGRRRRVAVFR